jgi:uncharacterized membrane protein YfhO
MMVDGADAEISALDSLDSKSVATVDVRYADYVKGIASGAGSTVKLTNYNPNKLSYEAEISSGEQLVVFSEIFYEGGGKDWKARIDGKEVEHIRVNYLLRGLKVPAGKHEIEFSFEPRAYVVGEKLALGGSLVFLLFFGFGLFKSFKKH